MGVQHLLTSLFVCRGCVNKDFPSLVGKCPVEVCLYLGCKSTDRSEYLAVSCCFSAVQLKLRTARIVRAKGGNVITCCRGNIKHYCPIKFFSWRIHLDLIIHESLSTSSNVGFLANRRNIVQSVCFSTILAIVTDRESNGFRTLYRESDKALTHVLVIGLPSVNAIANFLN